MEFYSWTIPSRQSSTTPSPTAVLRIVPRRWTRVGGGTLRFESASLNGTAASTAWESPEHREAVARDVGRAVAGITEPRFDAHGWITGGGRERLTRETDDWSQVLADAIKRQAAEIPYPDRFVDVPDRVAALLRRASDILDGATPALLHQDIRPGNVLRDGQPGVIDWEWVLVGDPGLGLCWGEAWVAERAAIASSDRDRLREAVRDGFRTHAGDLPEGYERRRPFYRVVTFLPKPKTFDRWAPSAQESTADLAAWVRDELDDRIATADSVS